MERQARRALKTEVKVKKALAPVTPVVPLGPKSVAPAFKIPTGADKGLTQMFTDLNGLDSYIPSAVADEPLAHNKMCVIPDGLIKALNDPDLQTIGTQARVNSEAMVCIAIVNYGYLKAGGHPDALTVSCVRGLVVSRGIQLASEVPDVSGRLIARACKVPEYLVQSAAGLDADILDAGSSTRKEVIDAFAAFGESEYSKLALLLPVMASLQFIKTNHHYPGGPEAKEAYKRHFKSCLLDTLEAKYNRPSVIYDAVHFLGPFTMNQIKVNLAISGRGFVPRGLRLKLKATPAGTAIVKTQLAVWQSIDAFPGGKEITAYYADDLEDMRALATTIEEDPLAFHVYSSLFEKEGRLETEETVEGMAAASKLAAVAQGFIDTVAKDTDLASAKALKKHAQMNITLYKIATAGFKGSMRRINREAMSAPLIEVISMRKAHALPPPVPAPPGAIVPVESIPQVIEELEI